jgi:hypothetical protein
MEEEKGLSAQIELLRLVGYLFKSTMEAAGGTKGDSNLPSHFATP